MALLRNMSAAFWLTFPHMPDLSAKKSAVRGSMQSTGELSLQTADGTFGPALSDHFQATAASVRTVLLSFSP